MPLVTEAGFIVGASYGRGALRVGGVSVDYFSATSGSLGFQIGAQQYAHVLFFMTQEALHNFRNSPGFIGDAQAEYAFVDAGGNLSVNTVNANMSQVIAVVFGQVGVQVGASLEGTKYNRIIP